MRHQIEPESRAAIARPRALGAGTLPTMSRRVATGLSEIDRVLGELHSDLIVVGGRPNTGKTSLALTIAQAAVHNRSATGFFTLESSKDRCNDRLLSSMCSIENFSLRRYMGQLTESELAQEEINRNLLNAYVKIDDSTRLTFADLLERAERMKRKYNIGLLVIDYLQLLDCTTGMLKALAEELDIPIIALSQLRRTPLEQRNDKRPTMADFPEGFADEYCDMILLTYRDEIYNPASPDKGLAEIIIGKHPSGLTSTVLLQFQPTYMRFTDLPLKGLA